MLKRATSLRSVATETPTAQAHLSAACRAIRHPRAQPVPPVLGAAGYSRFPRNLGRDLLSALRLQGVADATAGVHRRTERRRGGVVAGRAHAAVGDAGDRIPSPGSLETDSNRTNAVQRGLVEIGYVEGQTVTIEYRGALYRYGRLPALAADLVSRQVSVIIVVSQKPTLAAMAGRHHNSDRVRRGQ